MAFRYFSNLLLNTVNTAVKKMLKSYVTVMDTYIIMVILYEL